MPTASALQPVRQRGPGRGVETLDLRGLAQAQHQFLLGAADDILFPLLLHLLEGGGVYGPFVLQLDDVEAELALSRSPMSGRLQREGRFAEFGTMRSLVK